ncbi:MAG TPA: hypothetical protein VNW92_09910 [Polyangiaceae bacterium]|jgi:hypothetical protein|nr:hypothetical protein [Polyangiaceae bacterium]
MSSLLLALGEDTTAIRLSYDAPTSCPAEAAFYDAIQARTEHVHRATNDEAALEVSVRVSRTERGFLGEVRETANHSESSARSVDGATCKEVVEALSLTIALSVDPNAHAPVAKLVTPPPAPIVCPRAAEPRPIITAPAGPPLELEVGLGVLATEVLSSDLSAGAALSATLSRQTGEERSASLALALLFSATGVLTNPADHRAQFEGIALDACPARWRFADIELGPCALASVGVLEVTGRGVSEPATVERGWWSAGLDFQLSALLGHGLVLESALGATAPLIKRRFYLSLPEHVVAETPVVSPLLRLGVGFRF